MKNYALHRSLHARGWTTTKLAARLGTSRSQVSQTLNNDPGRGYRTRGKLAPLLTPDELALVGWDAQGNRTFPAVPHGTMSQPESTPLHGLSDGPATPKA